MEELFEIFATHLLAEQQYQSTRIDSINYLKKTAGLHLIAIILSYSCSQKATRLCNYRTSVL